MMTEETPGWCSSHALANCAMLAPFSWEERLQSIESGIADRRLDRREIEVRTPAGVSLAIFAGKQSASEWRPRQNTQALFHTQRRQFVLQIAAHQRVIRLQRHKRKCGHSQRFGQVTRGPVGRPEI